MKGGPTDRLRALEIGDSITVPLNEYNRWWLARDRVIHRDNYNVTWEKTEDGYVLCRIA